MKNFNRYSLYAIGEIILVVIGILIAVAINNYNERRKEKSLLKTYINDFRNDLKIDSTVVGQNLKILELKQEAFDLVLSDTMKRDDLLSKPLTFALVLTYNPFKFQSKGYNELKNYVANSEGETDTLVTRIVAQHDAYQELLENTMQRISDDINDNLMFFKNNKPWIGDLMSNNLTDDVIEYFLGDDYRNRVAIHKVLVYGNLYTFLEAYQKYIKTTLHSINERLVVENDYEEMNI